MVDSAHARVMRGPACVCRGHGVRAPRGQSVFLAQGLQGGVQLVCVASSCALDGYLPVHLYIACFLLVLEAVQGRAAQTRGSRRAPKSSSVLGWYI